MTMWVPRSQRPRRASQSERRRGEGASGDPGLQSLLAHIGRRRARQRARLVWAREPCQQATKTTTQADAPNRSHLQVQAIHWLTADLVQLRLERPPDLEYEAGQYVKLALAGVRRSFSLVSAPHEPALEFFIERVPGGAFSSVLSELNAGDEVELAAAPKGDFTLDSRYPDQLMVATVTGIGPFVGMLRSIAHQGPPSQRFIVVQGASYQDELGYRDELEALAARYPQQVIYVPTISRPEEARNVGWIGETGRAHEVAERLAQQYGLSPERTLAYACGNPGMVDGASARFSERGFAVKAERFD